MAGRSYKNEYEAPVAGDGVRYTTAEGVLVEGVLAEVQHRTWGSTLRARVCNNAGECKERLNGQWLDYSQLRRIPG